MNLLPSKILKLNELKTLSHLSSMSYQYRRILTGSPVTKNPLDLYSQCEFLNEELLDFTSYYAFRNRYAEMKTLHIAGKIYPGSEWVSKI